MKTQMVHLKQILKNNKEDLMYSLLIGVLFILLLLLFNHFTDYSKLF